MDRADDHAGAALAYYGSRGETPLVWGGSGAHLLGLEGEARPDDYRAIFGPGGARLARTGAKLVTTRRPGIELVVSPHKSVAELGVLGRADDMHAIVDAERDATLAYLDACVRRLGGRRGERVRFTRTGGLTWATSRHATTRAGDPQVHDHVLIANVVWMRDERGGWKALDTAFVRDQLHAATAIGRMASARQAVELGYAIEPDAGRSGRLGGWRIAGFPDAALAIHAKRSAQIDDMVGEGASSRSRAIAARIDRDRKRHEPVADLLRRWRAELTDAGFPPAELWRSVVAAAHQRPPVADRLADDGVGRLDPGRLAPGQSAQSSQGVPAFRRDRGRRPASARPPGHRAGPGRRRRDRGCRLRAAARRGRRPHPALRHRRGARRRAAHRRARREARRPGRPERHR